MAYDCRVVDLARFIKPPIPGFTNIYIDPDGYHLWQIVSENVFWGQIRNPVDPSLELGQRCLSSKTSRNKRCLHHF